MMFTTQQIQAEIERVIKVTRETTLADERARVSRAIYLHANTLADERLAEAVLELLPFLYDLRDHTEAMA